MSAAAELLSDEQAEQHVRIARAVLTRQDALERVREILDSWHPLDVERFRAVLEVDAKGYSESVRRAFAFDLPPDADVLFGTLRDLEQETAVTEAAQAVRILAAGVIALAADRRARGNSGVV